MQNATAAFTPLRMRKDRRARIEALIETLISLIDVHDGDTDVEDDDQDSCCAMDDIGTSGRYQSITRINYRGPGDPEDAEPEAAWLSNDAIHPSISVPTKDISQ